MAEISKLKLPNGEVYDLKVLVEHISGQLPISKGGTGASTASAARANLQLMLIGQVTDSNEDNYLLPSQVYNALNNGQDVFVSYFDKMYGQLKFSSWSVAITLGAVISNSIIYYDDSYILYEFIGDINTDIWNKHATILQQILDFDNVPTQNSLNPVFSNGIYSALNSKLDTTGNAYRSVSIPMGQVDSTSTATAFTAKISGINELRDGVCVMLKNGKVTSASGCTLNINDLGAKPIYNTMETNTRVTTAWNVAYTMLFVYNSTRVSGGCWDMYYGINTTYSALNEDDMEAGTATTARLITAQRLKQAVLYHAPVTSVNGSTGDVTVTVPTKTSDLTNDAGFTTLIDVGNAGYINDIDVTEMLAQPSFKATDATSKTVLNQVFGVDVNILAPSTFTNQLLLLANLEPRTWFAWMNGTELEFARLSVSVDTNTSAITLYLRGRTSIATGIMGVDSTWTVTPFASDAEGVAY